MNKTSCLLSILFLFIPFMLYAQGEGAIPILELNPSPQSMGLAESGVSTTINEPLGSYYNPAILGYSSQTNSLGFQTYTTQPDWLGYHQMTLKTSAFSIGYNFGNVSNDMNISAGFGYSNFKLDFGNFLNSQLHPFDSYDKYDAYSLGVSFDYSVNLSFGINYKKIESVLGSNSQNPSTVKLDAIDWGILLNVPVSKLAFEDYKYRLTDNDELKPIVNFSLGYSRSNIGKEVVYIDPSQADPLPLMARLGYTLSLGVDMKFNNHSINLISDDIIVEADDILINSSDAGWSYQGGLFGDINIGRNLLLLKADDKVTLRKANRLCLFETLSLLNGSFFGPGWDSGRFTSGLVFSTNGLFKLVGWTFNDVPAYTFIFDHLEIQYVKATVFENTQLQTDLSSISILLNRLAF